MPGSFQLELGDGQALPYRAMRASTVYVDAAAIGGMPINDQTPNPKVLTFEVLPVSPVHDVVTERFGEAQDLPRYKQISLRQRKVTSGQTTLIASSLAARFGRHLGSSAVPTHSRSTIVYCHVDLTRVADFGNAFQGLPAS